jgi:hypothetical protein
VQQSKVRQVHRRQSVLSWEEQRRLNPFLVWDGSFRWFRSENVIPLERYRSLKEIERIQINVLQWLPKIQIGTLEA